MSAYKRLFLFAAFGCVGITTEIFFTAIVDLYSMIEAGPINNWRLQGKSYIWMFPIYGLAGILYPLVFKKIQNLHIILRMMIYGAGILTVEYITGFLLDKLTGQCPWEYTTGWHLHGYIRFDYFVLWAFFGLMVERIYLLLNRMHL